jgi:hypothetical protein
MTEIWLHTNRRAIAFALVGPALGLIVALLLVLYEVIAQWSAAWVLWVAGVLAILSALLAGLITWQFQRPRIAREADELLFYLQSGPPLRVPVAVVEGFLLGQGPSYLHHKRPDESIAATIVVRLAERASDFAQRDTKPALGTWCNHYVTIRGTWCEPLTLALVTRLNSRLAEAQAAAVGGHAER